MQDRIFRYSRSAQINSKTKAPQNNCELQSMVSLTKYTASLTLFGFHGSSTTNRIRMALGIKGIPYNFQVVDEGAANEQRSEEWTETMNALSQIPVLKVEQDGSSVVLRQSVAVNEYLEEAYPDTPKLLPDDPVARAKVRRCS